MSERSAVGAAAFDQFDIGLLDRRHEILHRQDLLDFFV